MAVAAEWMPRYIGTGTVRDQYHPAVLFGLDETSIGTHSREVQTTPLDMSWLQTAIQLGRDRFELEHLTLTVAQLEDAMRSGKFDLLSSALLGVPFDDVSPQLTITVLRITFAARVDIKKWSRAVDMAWESFERHGLDAARLLRGLR